MAAVEGSRPLNAKLPMTPEMEAFWKAVAQQWRNQEAQPDQQPQPEPTGNIMTPRNPGVPFFGRSRTPSAEPPHPAQIIE